MGIAQVPAPVSSSRSRRVDRFTASGSWTAPAGVTYVIAHVCGGGGGGGGVNSRGGAGVNSSAALGTTITGNGAAGGAQGSFGGNAGNSAAANSGRGATGNGDYGSFPGTDATEAVAGSTVVPGTSYTITVGAGGTAGTGGAGPGTGGSGYVWLEYEVTV